MVFPAILDKLSQLFKISINIDKSTHIQINSNNKITDKYIFFEDDNVLSINLNQLSSEEKEQLRQILQNSVDNGVPLLEENARERTEDIFLKEHSSEETDVLGFFKGKIPDDDYTALRASLYLRSRFKERATRPVIDELKMEIIQKYGRRGRNISDLCSAGYFDALKEIAENLHKNTFLEFYEEIVGKGAFTIFVSERTTSKQLIQDINKRITTNRRYGGTGILQIHGIGRKNIETIKIAMDDIEEIFQNITLNTRLDNRVMVVTIKF
ncbi:hypothetical protein ACKUB1_12105 [Methanospirillum stamsii]|uniref:Uncharacterized protein n=1 Tax=Methanospirillum stamsii TaxID=1277351 RepID=A0A2V2MVY8_9EURY|nr:hypothetical protein [Methanospirillum stamsii]PWR70460.1 hypothetical protein DLD82_15410 [Methanospirillum stamsii]